MKREHVQQYPQKPKQCFMKIHILLYNICEFKMEEKAKKLGLFLREWPHKLTSFVYKSTNTKRK